MALRVGDMAPDFDVVGYQAGKKRIVRLSDFRGQQSLVLYFYPRDFTPVCTREACGFRDAYEELKGKGAEVIGVSLDDDATHGRFAERHGLPFVLVADSDKSMARAYGALSLMGNLFGSSKRLTYVIDKQGRVVAVFDSALLASKHVDGAREAIAKLP
jgi:peroxiredoxin Q/BCP